MLSQFRFLLRQVNGLIQPYVLLFIGILWIRSSTHYDSDVERFGEQAKTSISRRWIRFGFELHLSTNNCHGISGGETGRSLSESHRWCGTVSANTSSQSLQNFSSVSSLIFLVMISVISSMVSFSWGSGHWAWRFGREASSPAEVKSCHLSLLLNGGVRVGIPDEWQWSPFRSCAAGRILFCRPNVKNIGDNKTQFSSFLVLFKMQRLNLQSIIFIFSATNLVLTCPGTVSYLTAP